MAFTKPSVKLGVGPHGDGQRTAHDSTEFVSPAVVIAYRKRPAGGYPTPGMKTKLKQAALQARNIVRIANDMLAKVVLLPAP